MAFDFKKEYKELYAPKKGPSILEVPPMHFVAVRGSGDPNDVEGACLLYTSSTRSRTTRL